MSNDFYGDVNFKSAFQTIYGVGVTPASGWVEVSETWTYNSSVSVNIPTDATTKYQVGDFVRWKQGGAYKYGVFELLTTTLGTFITNIDFSVANSAITDIAFSRGASPFGWPGWFKRIADAGSGVTLFSGTGGTVGSLAVTVNKLKYRPLGRTMLEVLDLKITATGSYTGPVLLQTCVSSAAADAGNAGWGGGLWADATLAPKGYMLVSTSTSIRFAKTPNTRIQWTDIAVNDWIQGRIEYQW